MKILVESANTTDGTVFAVYRGVERGVYELHLLNGTADNASRKENHD